LVFPIDAVGGIQEVAVSLGIETPTVKADDTLAYPFGYNDNWYFRPIGLDRASQALPMITSCLFKQFCDHSTGCTYMPQLIVAPIIDLNWVVHHQTGLTVPEEGPAITIKFDDDLVLGSSNDIKDIC